MNESGERGGRGERGERGENDETGESGEPGGDLPCGACDERGACDEHGDCDECVVYGESAARGAGVGGGVRPGVRGGGRRPAVTLEEAERVCAELDAALRAVGIKLPSLWIEATTYANDYLPPLVQLGRCDVDTARALLAVARTAPGRTGAVSTPV